MSPGTVRWGGIMVFIGIALVFLIPIGFVAVIGLDRMAPNARGIGSMGGQMQIMSVVMNVAMAAVIGFVFFTTKGYFNALGYHRADIAIYLIIGVQVLSAVFGAVTNTSAGLSGIMQAGGLGAMGVLGVVVLITTLAVLVAMLIFSIFCISFGNIGGGLWKAIGILYLIGLIGIIIGVIIIAASAGMALGSGSGSGAAGMAGAAVMATVLIIIGFLCYAAAIICHGIGLILAAGRLERESNPVEVFD
ncbi:MAG TPA: hypothetical protein VM325_02860 [Alphaproteobacteria bacterium]|nr:hypothetical protein [Alphaproteobacteria bacterium]